MITGFEEITAELSNEEMKHVAGFVKALNKRVGKKNAVTSTEIMSKINGMSGPRIRKIINYIRNNYLVTGLIATSAGYYISTDPEEIKKYIVSLEQRERAISEIRKKTIEYLLIIQNGLDFKGHRKT